jgi:glutamine amidotransferase
MKKKIVIVDYGLGNILSAQQSFLKVVKDCKKDIPVIISSDPEDINRSSHIVLPGQGAFVSCINGLKQIPGMISALEKNVIKKKKPFLGICVGMQLLAERGFENGNHEGLGWIKGSVKKLEVNNLKLPHMGWNNIEIINNLVEMNFDEGNNKDFYFVHTYHFDCFEPKNIIALTNYGISFPSIVGKENIYGFQFHPEKSSDQGLQLIKNFLTL